MCLPGCHDAPMLCMLQVMLTWDEPHSPPRGPMWRELPRASVRPFDVVKVSCSKLAKQHCHRHFEAFQTCKSQQWYLHCLGFPSCNSALTFAVLGSPHVQICAFICTSGCSKHANQLWYLHLRVLPTCRSSLVPALVGAPNMQICISM